MKKTTQIGLFIAVVHLLSAGAFGQGGLLYVKVKRENIRKAPNGDRMGEVLAGTRVEVLEKRPKWVKIQFTGWIWENSLTSDSTMVDGFRIRASHILVKTEAEANRILDQLGQGADFEELANRFSSDRASGDEGGDVGIFGRGDLMPEFEETVFRLRVGEVSGVVKTALGYHIIKRTE